MLLHIANWGINPYFDIIIMLLTAFILGYLLKSVIADTGMLKRKIKTLETELEEISSVDMENKAAVLKLENELSIAQSKLVAQKYSTDKIKSLENELRLSKSKVLTLESELANRTQSVDNENLQAAKNKIQKLEHELSETKKDNSNFIPSQTIEDLVQPSDDLTKIEGIGPKIQSLCNEIGIYTFEHLAKSNLSDLRKMLDAEGKHFAVHDPASWPAQAQMAFEGKWGELTQWQVKMKGGKV